MHKDTPERPRAASYQGRRWINPLDGSFGLPCRHQHPAAVFAAVNTHAMNILTRVTPEAYGKLGIELTVADESGATLAKARLLGHPNDLLHAGGPGADGHSRYSIDITPLEGCPARAAERVKNAAAA